MFDNSNEKEKARLRNQQALDKLYSAYPIFDSRNKSVVVVENSEFYDGLDDGGFDRDYDL